MQLASQVPVSSLVVSLQLAPGYCPRIQDGVQCSSDCPEFIKEADPIGTAGLTWRTDVDNPLGIGFVLGAM